jgi:hypothetical protein
MCARAVWVFVAELARLDRLCAAHRHSNGGSPQVILPSLSSETITGILIRRLGRCMRQVHVNRSGQRD